jgi:hypothetical protein
VTDTAFFRQQPVTAKARAIDVGVNYFNTAVQYGNGQSEKKSRPYPAKPQTDQQPVRCNRGAGGLSGTGLWRDV